MLEPYILSDKLSYLHPTCMKDFVYHYQEKGYARRIENCIVHLNILSIDFHQVAQLCKKYYLATAFFYIFNRGLRDFVSPLQDIMVILSKNIQEKRIGYTILLYLNKCLLGEEFPSGGSLPEKLYLPLKEQLVDFLFSEHPKDYKEYGEEQKSFPRLRVLFKFDCKRTFEFLTVVFNDNLFSTQDLMDSLQSIFIDKQIEVDPLKIQFYFQNVSEHWTNQQTGYFLMFACKQLSIKKCVLSNYMIQRIIGYLTLTEEDSSWMLRHELTLTFVKNISENLYRKDLIQILAKSSSFYLVTEHFERLERNWPKLLKTAIEASSTKNNKSHVFSLLGNLLEDSSLSFEDKKTIKQQVMTSLKELINIDGGSIAQLIIQHFEVEDHKKLMLQIDSYPELQYIYLKEIMAASNLDFPSSLHSEEQQKSQFVVDSDTVELYIRLLCKYEPSNVVNFLKIETLYRLEKALSICREFNSIEGVIYLLERSGDVKGALSERLNLLEKQIVILRNYLSNNKNLPKKSLSHNLKSSEELKVENLIKGTFSLCKRYAKESGMNETNENLWFSVLGFLISNYNLEKISKQSENNFTSLILNYIRECLNNMIGYVKLPRILER